MNDLDAILNANKIHKCLHEGVYILNLSTGNTYILYIFDNDKMNADVNASDRKEWIRFYCHLAYVRSLQLTPFNIAQMLPSIQTFECYKIGETRTTFCLLTLTWHFRFHPSIVFFF